MAVGGGGGWEARTGSPVPLLLIRKLEEPKKNHVHKLGLMAVKDRSPTSTSLGEKGKLSQRPWSVRSCRTGK